MQLGILVAGGYYNGIATMFLPISPYLTPPGAAPGGPRRGGGALRTEEGWRWFGSMPGERKWGPALGRIDGRIAIAGGPGRIAMT